MISADFQQLDLVTKGLDYLKVPKQNDFFVKALLPDPECAVTARARKVLGAKGSP